MVVLIQSTRWDQLLSYEQIELITESLKALSQKGSDKLDILKEVSGS